MGNPKIIQIIRSITAISLLCTPVLASEAMPIAITVEDNTPKKEKNLSKKCVKASANKKRFLSRVTRLKYSDNMVHDYFTGFYRGQYGCLKDSEFAHQILDRHVGYPIRQYIRSYDFDLLLSNHREALTEQRIKDLEGAFFLRAPAGANAVPTQWTMEEIEDLLLSNDNWKLAANIFLSDKNYVRNKLRDDLLIKNLIDPESAIYNLEKSVELVSDSSRYSYQLRVAEQLAKRKSNDTDVRTAFELMQWYSPFVRRNISQEDADAAVPIFNKIVQLMAHSNEVDLQAKSKAIQQTGNPHAGTGPQSTDIPDDPENSYLTISWPEKFGERRTIRSPNSYPSRAFRERIGGRVQAAALFNPDGSYGGMMVISSSGRMDLDRATTKNLERYNGLKSKTLSGFAGEYIKIPMPVIEWCILDEDVVGESGVFISDDKVKVVAKAFKPTILH